MQFIEASKALQISPLLEGYNVKSKVSRLCTGAFLPSTESYFSSPL